ncbi:MAG: hypothetical protein CMP59_06415 [Flavobacteriales bacterium]|nr:hypothetical protein [Flavobacteriales bacterium]
MPNANITHIIELNGDQVMLTGDFDVGSFSDVLLINSRGIRINSFAPGPRDGGYLFWYNDSIIGVVGTGNLNFIDTNGNVELLQYRDAFRKTVRCPSFFTPYVFSNGSLLVSNSFGTSPNSCRIIVPPDTFPHRYMIKVDSIGTWDSSFAGIANEVVQEFIKYDSNRILLSGFHNRFTHFNSQRVNGLCRIYQDGQLDSSFSSPFQDNSIGYVSAVYLEQDGKIVLGGEMNIVGYPNALRLVRLNSNGSLDTGFYFNSQLTNPEFPTGVISSIIGASDGGYIISGSFDSIQGVSKNHLAKLDSNGIIEPQFFTTIGPDSSTSPFFDTPGVRVTRSNSGDLYVYGDFRYWDGQPSQPIVRLTDFSVGIKKFEQSKKTIRVYPNPSKDGVIMFSNSDNILETRVYDISGKLQLLYSSVSTIQLPEAKGLYLLQITFRDGSVETHKVIRQ